MRFAYSPLSSVINYRRRGTHPPGVRVLKRAELGLGWGGGRLSCVLQPQRQGSGRNGASGADLPLRLKRIFSCTSLLLTRNSLAWVAGGRDVVVVQQLRRNVGAFLAVGGSPFAPLKASPPFEWAGVACFLGERAL